MDEHRGGPFQTVQEYLTADNLEAFWSSLGEKGVEKKGGKRVPAFGMGGLPAAGDQQPAVLLRVADHGREVLLHHPQDRFPVVGLVKVGSGRGYWSASSLNCCASTVRARLAAGPPSQRQDTLSRPPSPPPGKGRRPTFSCPCWRSDGGFFVAKPQPTLPGIMVGQSWCPGAHLPGKNRETWPGGHGHKEGAAGAGSRQASPSGGQPAALDGKPRKRPAATSGQLEHCLPACTSTAVSSWSGGAYVSKCMQAGSMNCIQGLKRRNPSHRGAGAGQHQLAPVEPSSDGLHG